MVDNAESITNKRKQPDQEPSESTGLKRTKTEILKPGVSFADDDEEQTPEDELVKEDEEEDEQDDEEEDEEDDEDDEEEGDEEGETKEKAPESTKSSSSSSKAGSSKQATELSDHDDDNISDGELEALDTSLIINTGRRTRGKKIDYTQFGADTPADEV